jgi:uncharacterized protein
VSSIRFEWDERKNLSNQRKHGIGFEAASRIFLDPLFISIKDRVQEGEERWRTYGEVDDVLLLMVAHTVREEAGRAETFEVIRIISARRATRRERQRYEEENR